MTCWLTKETHPQTTAPPILIGGRSDFLLAAPLDIPGEREQPQPEMLADFLRFTRLVAFRLKWYCSTRRSPNHCYINRTISLVRVESPRSIVDIQPYREVH